MGEFKEALDSLYHYFDRQKWSGGESSSKISGDADENEAERCHRLKYAALNLAVLHCRFGHRYGFMFFDTFLASSLV